jgi:hypothetical protein
MRKILMLVLLISTSITANNINNIREVLKHVETSYNSDLIGDGGASFGILQIQKGVILDINRKFGTDYTHQDAFEVNCAEEIFELYIQMYTDKLEKREARAATEEDIVRIWNGGPRGYQRSSTLGYLVKYKETKEKLTMAKRKCYVRGKMGAIMENYTHTVDVFMFKTRKMMYGVSKKYIHMVPQPAKITGNTNQLKLMI